MEATTTQVTTTAPTAVTEGDSGSVDGGQLQLQLIRGNLNSVRLRGVGCEAFTPPSRQLGPTEAQPPYTGKLFSTVWIGYVVDLKGYVVALKGYVVDLKGYSVDLKGYKWRV
eukprot:7053961-Pyramimonas_sp.AAC.1